MTWFETLWFDNGTTGCPMVTGYFDRPCMSPSWWIMKPLMHWTSGGRSSKQKSIEDGINWTICALNKIPIEQMRLCNKSIEQCFNWTKFATVWQYGSQWIYTPWWAIQYWVQNHDPNHNGSKPQLIQATMNTSHRAEGFNNFLHMWGVQRLCSLATWPYGRRLVRYEPSHN